MSSFEINAYLTAAATLATFAMTVANTSLNFRNMLSSTLYLRDDQLKIDAILNYTERIHSWMDVTSEDGLKIWYFPQDMRHRINHIYDRVHGLRSRQDVDVEAQIEM